MINKSESLLTESNNITIIYQGKIFIGNNQQMLLEQLEENGFSIPYSCRIGICGYCKLSLIKGKIKPPNKVINKNILSCCSIPATSLELA
ncbi:MAG: 2Fe-2S iron-sulfur cluster binding domain-containing protein [Candidatus Dasytiphilus stammeri]